MQEANRWFRPRSPTTRIHRDLVHVFIDYRSLGEVCEGAVGGGKICCWRRGILRHPNKMTTATRITPERVESVGGGKAIGAEAVIGARFLLETYLDGDEVDVDVIMSDGEWQFAAVSDNGPTSLGRQPGFELREGRWGFNCQALGGAGSSTITACRLTGY
eukprot:Skav225063  [mRNA]  locus=scaffold2293:45582:47699:- [translate_table: standard]